MGLNLKKLLGAQRLSSQFSAESCTQLSAQSQELLTVLQTSFTNNYSQVYLTIPKNYDFNLGSSPQILSSRALSISSANLEGVIQSLSPPNLILNNRTYYSSVNDLTSQQILLALGYSLPADEIIGAFTLSGNYLSFKPVKVAHSSPVTVESPLYFTTFIEPAFQQLQQSLTVPLATTGLIIGPQIGNVLTPDVPFASTFTQVRWLSFEDFTGYADKPVEQSGVFFVPNENWSFKGAFSAQSLMLVDAQSFWAQYLTVSLYGSITKFFNDPSPTSMKRTVQEYTITFPYLEEEFPEKFPYTFPYSRTPGPYTDNRIIVRTNEGTDPDTAAPTSLQPYQECDANKNMDCLGTRMAWDTPSFLLNETNSLTFRSLRQNTRIAGNWYFNQCNSANPPLGNGGNDETLNHCECTQGYTFLGQGQNETRVILSIYNCFREVIPALNINLNNGQHRANPLGSIFTCKMFQWFTKHGKGSAMPITISYNY
jgi:hypothetical protein